MKKCIMASLVVMLCVLQWSDDGVGQEVPAPRGELRIVDKNPQNWAFITFNVFEHRRCFTCVGPLRGLVQTHSD